MTQLSHLLNRVTFHTKDALLTSTKKGKSVQSANKSSIFNGEILSLPMLEQLAYKLATEDITIAKPGSFRPMQRKLSHCQKDLWQAYRGFSNDVRNQVAIPPAGEWLLDNFSLVLDQVREIEEDLPNDYYHKLPKLSNTPLAGYLRVYALAMELLKHTDSHLDEEHLLRFIHAYQTISTFTMGELWAIAIMLRLGLVERLANLANELMSDRQLRQEGVIWADRLILSGNKAVPGKSGAEFELLQKYPQFPPAFTVQLLRNLHDHEGFANPENPLTRLEQQLSLQNMTSETLIRQEKQNQAANQTRAGNIITSMRFLSAFNWTGWFENVSKVEQILARDQAGIYSKSTFATRDHYRHEVENLARNTGKSEMAVAWQVIELAKNASQDRDPESPTRHSHVGSYTCSSDLYNK